MKVRNLIAATGIALLAATAAGSASASVEITDNPVYEWGNAATSFGCTGQIAGIVSGNRITGVAYKSNCTGRSVTLSITNASGQNLVAPIVRKTSSTPNQLIIVPTTGNIYFVSGAHAKGQFDFGATSTVTLYTH